MASSEQVAHIKTCSRCGAIAAEQLLLTQEGQREVVPERLLERAQRSKPAVGQPKPRSWAMPVFATLATCCILAVFATFWRPETNTSLPGSEDFQSKGAASLVGSVMRDGKLVYDDVALWRMHVQPGDNLRVRITGSDAGFVALQGMDEGRWATLYAGPRPADGWLPVLTITTEGATRLRLILCPQAVSLETDLPATCQVQGYDL